MKEYFRVSVNQYCPQKNFIVLRPASLSNPKDNAVMFITKEYMIHEDSFLRCKECLVFWPKDVSVSDQISRRHAVVLSDDPRTEYCRFYRDNNIVYYPEIDDFEVINGAYIAKSAVIGKNCKIFPGAYIGGEVVMGDNVYIGSGAKLVGSIRVGNNVVIRENAVLGADGLSTNRDEDGKAVTMPQFGGIILEDDVQIGALSVIGRGAIDNTIIGRGSKIDNSCFVSHNVQMGEDTFMVGESIMFGSSSTGAQAYISGNACIRDGIHVGRGALVGMGAVVVKPVGDGSIVKGNPAK